MIEYALPSGRGLDRVCTRLGCTHVKKALHIIYSNQPHMRYPYICIRTRTYIFQFIFIVRRPASTSTVLNNTQFTRDNHEIVHKSRIHARMGRRIFFFRLFFFSLFWRTCVDQPNRSPLACIYEVINSFRKRRLIAVNVIFVDYLILEHRHSIYLFYILLLCTYIDLFGLYATKKSKRKLAHRIFQTIYLL